MNTIIDPIKRAEFWKNRLVGYASTCAEPRERQERRIACRDLFIDEFKQMRAEQEKGLCAEVDGFWSERLTRAVRDLMILATPDPESPYVAKLNSQIVKEKDDDIRILKEALAAAEAECAEWRKDAGLVSGKVWVAYTGEECSPEIRSADANDATRARLGLKPIGEVRDAAEVDRRTAYWQSIVDGSERYRQDHARCMGKKNPAQAAAIQDQADRLTASFFEQYHDDLRNGRCKPVKWPAWLVGEAAH